MKHLIIGLLALPMLAGAQGSGGSYWLQRVKYAMDIDVNAAANRFTGRQKLEYWNNSPDTLRQVFYHLYWNAFQPGSMMDQRSQRQGTVANARGGPDWDARVKDRISKLTPDEAGYQKVLSLKMNGRPQAYRTEETILVVNLDRPIAPRAKAVFDMEFEAQVPVQIRRSGRDNAEGVRFTMTQWYPKMAEYDKDGWHPNPYIAREFYGVWGDYDVKISIDKSYVVGATGYLQNPGQVGHGYEAPGTKVQRPAGNRLQWHFVAPNVHDFAWAADPDYVHRSRKVRDGMTLHAFYKVVPELLTKQYDALPEATRKEYGSAQEYIAGYKGQWEELLDLAGAALPFMDKTFGKYPYKQYSFIQGGDGGMEYPMATMIKGAGPDLAIHEWMHSWYQGVIATNESLYAWMDEGFTSYAESRVMHYLGLATDTVFPQRDNYAGYYSLARSGKEEPLTTHADYFNTNFAYTSAAYTKGAVFMEQLGYIVGAPVRDRILLEYYRQWGFKHPDVDDFMRLAEKESNVQLDWYKAYWVNTTKTIDYSIDSLWEGSGATNIRLRNIGMIPMPMDVKITFRDGSSEWHYVPMNLMFGSKPAEPGQAARKTYAPWKWTQPTYSIQTARRLTDITSVEIDPSLRLADLDRKNNRLELKW